VLRFALALALQACIFIAGLTPVHAQEQAVNAPSGDPAQTQPASTQPPPTNNSQGPEQQSENLNRIINFTKTITVEQSNGLTKIVFPFDVADVKSAAYRRGNQLWVVFDQPVEMEFKPITHVSKEEFKFDPSDIYWIKNIRKEPIDEAATFVVMDFAKFLYEKPYVSMTKDGNNWILTIEIADKVKKSPWDEIVYAVSKPYATPYPYVEMNLRSNITLIRYEDPYVGDDIVVAPLAAHHKYVDRNYQYIDFNIMETAQGVVVQRISDTAVVNQNGPNLRISAAGGVNISKRIFARKSDNKGDKEKQDGHSRARRTVDVADLRFDDETGLSLNSYVVENKNFEAQQDKILHSIIKAENDDDKLRFHMNLALFYLANGLYKEATAAYNYIAENYKQEKLGFRYKLLGAVSYYMDHRYQRAFEIIGREAINNIPSILRPEVRFWKAVVRYQSGFVNDIIMGNDEVDFFTDRDKHILVEYPQHIISRLGFTMLENQLEMKNFAAAEKILKTMDTMGFSAREKNSKEYYWALYSIAIDATEETIVKHLEKCMNDYSDVYNRARCRLQSVKYRTTIKDITIDEALQELEKIAVIWRGDDLEIGIQQEIGDMYLKSGQVQEALRTWKRVKNNYPTHAQSLILERKMNKVFIDYFLKSNQKTPVEAFEATATFYEFKELMPIGRIGDRIIEKLIANLVKLDLVESASDLLAHLIKNRLSGTNKERAINELLRLYIAQNKIDEAMSTLSLGDDYEDLPQDIRTERKFMHARLLGKKGRVEAAMDLLVDEDLRDADPIKSQIFWENKKWDKFTLHSEPYLYSIIDNKDTLSDEDLVKLVMQCIAYIKSGQQELLRKTYDAFKDRLPNAGRYAELIEALRNVAAISGDKSLIEIITQSKKLENLLNDLIKIIRQKNSKPAQ
jgi:tetratricopeptide (TPR) repeat protein